MSIDMLPDVALLEIFDFYLGDEDLNPYLEQFVKRELTAWHSLVHVCRKWRNVVFGSPLRLNLRLYCEPRRTPVRERMAVWPSFPIVVSNNCDKIRDNEKWVDNIVAAFEHSNRICRLNLDNIRSWQLENALAAMQQPFPALTHLSLRLKDDETAPILPDPLMGGSAPQLQSLVLSSILFPGLPNLLLSATQLVRLHLWVIPHSGYISPEKMVACLSVLTRLEDLSISFESPQSRPDRNSQRVPPPTRSLLPALNQLGFEGASEYLEDLLARIDAPLLYFLEITFFHQLIFDTPQLTEFISRCAPKFKKPDEAHLAFYSRRPEVALHSQGPHFERLIFGVSCNQSDWQLSFMTQMCSSSFPQGLIPTVENLYIQEFYLDFDPSPPWLNDIEGSQWLEVLQPFTAVKTLYVSEKLMPRIASALQELVGERATEVLPALQTLFLRDLSLSGPVQDAIDEFVAARQLAGHPVAVSRWRWETDSESDESSNESPNKSSNESSNESDEEEVESSYEADDGYSILAIFSLIFILIFFWHHLHLRSNRHSS
jgi:hypothetical protein